MDTSVQFANTWLSRPPVVVADSSTAEQAPTSGADQVIGVNHFDADSEHDRCELIRDVVAIANSGGGRLIVPAAINDTDILRWLAEYTGTADFEINVRGIHQAGVSATEITVGAAALPIGFSKQATFQTSQDSDRPQQVFPAGSFYFRHGERSEPGTTADMRNFFERVLRRARRRWLRGIRRVLAAALAPVVGKSPQQIAAKKKTRGLANLQPVRIVTDPDAPALHPQDVDRLYPWRQKDLLRELNSRLGRRALNSYDIHAVRRQHRLDERPEFVFNLPGAGRRYSPVVADWIIEEYGSDPDFFKQSRAADQKSLRLRRQKPR
jgi:hypothetical protein